jgi:hypothetical protein
VRIRGKTGNRVEVEVREGIYAEQKEEREQAWRRGKKGNIVRRGNRQGAQGREGIGEEPREKRE